MVEDLVNTLPLWMQTLEPYLKATQAVEFLLILTYRFYAHYVTKSVRLITSTTLLSIFEKKRKKKVNHYNIVLMIAGKLAFASNE